MKRSSTHPGILALALGWFAALTSVLWLLIVHANTAGAPADAHLHWPESSKLTRPSTLPQLILFIHPDCPCSKASVAELDRLLPKIHGKVLSRVVLFRSEDNGALDLETWRQATSSAAEIINDADGHEALAFGAKTSGQTFLYDQQGHLIFSGGLTPERGHRGDSEGRQAILDYVENAAPIAAGHMQSASFTSTAVFGCSLRDPERASRKTLNWWEQTESWTEERKNASR